MNDFNAILGKMKTWANAAGKKTEEVVEASKLKLQIVSVSGDISKAYEELGAMVYHAAKNNETVGEEMDAVMDKIEALLEKLAILEGKVGEIKKVRSCPNCGAACAQDAQFCSRCGVILSTVEEVVDEAEESFEELCEDEECCGNCCCTGDCATCDDHCNKTCDHNCEECDCCDEDDCECPEGCCCESCQESCGCHTPGCSGDCSCCEAECEHNNCEEKCSCGCGCHCEAAPAEESCSCGCCNCEEEKDDVQA